MAENKESTKKLSQDIWLTDKELSEYWGVTCNTLQRWRTEGTGPVYLKLGGQPKYHIDFIRQFERDRMFRGTGEKIDPATIGGDDGKK